MPRWKSTKWVNVWAALGLTGVWRVPEHGGMSQLTVIAKLKAKPGAEEQLFQECRGLIAPTSNEEGCINYDMHRSIEDPGTFMFYENWANRPLWEKHMESPHLKAFSGKTEALTESWELFLGEKVGPG